MHKVEGRDDLQYGAWLRGELARRLGVEYSFTNKKEGGDTRYKTKVGVVGGQNDLIEPRGVVARDEQTIEASILDVSTLGELTKKYDERELTVEVIHENGKVRNLGEKPSEMLAQLGKKKWERGIGMGKNGGSMQKEIGTQHNVIPKFEFKSVLQALTSDCQVGLALGENTEGPVAMMYEVDVGWVVENLGSNSGHWKRRARAGPSKDIIVETGPI